MAPNNRPRMIHMNHLVQKLVRFVLRSLRVDILDWKGKILPRMGAGRLR